MSIDIHRRDDALAASNTIDILKPDAPSIVSKDNPSEKELLRDILECLKQHRKLEERDRDESSSDKETGSYSQLSSIVQVINAFWFLSVLFAIVSTASLAFAASCTFISKLVSIDLERYYELYKSGRPAWRQSHALPRRREPTPQVFKMAFRRILGMEMDKDVVHAYVSRVEQPHEQPRLSQETPNDQDDTQSLRNRELRVRGTNIDFHQQLAEPEAVMMETHASFVPNLDDNPDDRASAAQDVSNEQKFIVMMTVIMIPSLTALLVGLMVFVWARSSHTACP
ncbi:hypothetical protein EW145_g3190 [Phellinidium pouzarii]|uniref:Uncharacterized protein n=1 Tax=Phellinidium pouzarii TaxID=167371 RepID=A0A4S4L9H9_9AGAM|nr:hypothetical protein EW145_g3190 [Phellinidium pouzarii]